MATEQDLHQALINYLTLTLNNPPEEGVDPKVIEWAARFLEKREFTSISTPPPGSFEEDRLGKLKTKHGVE